LDTEKQYPKLQFILDKDDFTGGKIEFVSEITMLKLSDFKENSKIRAIRIY